MTTPNPYPNPNSYHIDRFDSLSTCNTDHLSLFDELQSRRQSSNNQSHFTPLDPVTEMEPPPPPPPPPSSNSTFYHHPSSNNSQQTPNKQPLHLQISNTSTTSQTSDQYAPGSAPIITNGEGRQPSSPNGAGEFELLNQQNLFSSGGNHHRPLSKMRSVSFKKAKKMAFPKLNDGYVNPAYQDDEGHFEDDQELVEEEEGDHHDPNFLQIPSSKQQQKSNYHQLHTTDPDAMFTSFEHPDHLESPEGVHLRNPGKHLSQYSSNLEEPQTPQTPANYDDDKEWDRFETLPPPDDDETVDSEWVKISIQWLKIAAYVFTFLCVLGFAVLSKAATLLMTSMIAVNHSVAVCNSDRSFVIHEPLQHDKIYKVQYGAEHLSRIAWIWCLYFAIVAPYVFAWLRALRICYFKSAKICSLATLATVFTFESLHCIGLSILMFLILPYVDVTKGAMMMNNVAVLPALIRLFVTSAPVMSKENTKAKTRKAMGLSTNRVITGVTLALQLLSVLLWTLIGYNERHAVERWYLIPVALILVSCEWWENYLIPERMPRYLGFLEAARRDLEENKSRYFVSCFTMLWKALLIFGLMVLNEFSFNSHDVATMMFRNFTDAFHSPTVPVTRVKMDGIVMESEHHLLYVDLALWPLFVLVGHIAVTYLCYAFGKFTCKVCIQEISFAIPVTIAVPVTVSLLWAMKNLEIQDKCQLSSRFSPFQYIFWNMGTMNSLGSFQYTGSSYEDGHGWLNILVSVLWFLCLCSQIAATLHIWKETSERLASTELLFVNPMYNAVLIDQSLAMNRRSIKIVFDGEKEDEETEEEKAAKAKAKKLSLQAAAAAGDEEAMRAFSRAQELKMEAEEGAKLYTGTFEQRKKSTQDSYFEGASNFDDEDDGGRDYAQEWAEMCASQGYDVDGIDPKCDPKDDDTVRIFACATMWHEDKNEMLQMLKAIMRLDKDQWAQAKAKEDFGAEESQYYEIETNIFFDDAYEQGATDAEDDRVVNRFVEQLIDVMNEAANHVHEQNIIIDYPTIVPTPYGGKLIWKLPGGNRLIAHVKDKDLIRHRKRWSQCMYMYYLLGYRLAARADLSEQRKRKIANNTFVLALDGDINFQPVAVHMVVDLMKKNSKLGAACGRIHPIGGGPIVWYQKFEYAIGHWLQKATEHVFGCVLCSPGCFSLFRARAVMDKSVMNKYTTKPSEALHYVQYDQGEDRWLCTLMLQRGWRIEYCAASDSYTHAPEGFGEFYTQRRRWAPSTMANILDLLGDYKQTVDRNENISLLYILYQAFLMVGTVLSPGTIFLMVVSAMNSAMNLDSRTSLLANVIPVLLFTFVCLKFKDNDIKINFAMLLSLIYALLMLAVMVGIGIDMYQQGILSPNALFFSCMMGSFLVAAIIHPQEFSCVLPLPLYMLLIPSMYMLLTIYSVTNMHIVAWGTREVKSKLSAKEVAAQKAEEEAKAKAAAEAAAKKSLFSQYLDVSKYGAGGGKNGLFTCMCCSGGQHTTDNTSTITEIAKNVTEMKVVVDQIRTQGGFVPGMSRRASLLTNSMPASGAETPLEGTDSGQNSLSPVEEASKEGSEVDDAIESINQAVENRKTSNPIPKWIRTNKRLSTFKIQPLHDRELHFWRTMIDKYLLPLIENLAEKERISNELIDLRNKSVFAFAFMNIIFILFVFMLQLHKDVFGIDIPVGIAGYNRTYNEEENSWHVETIVNKTRMDPITLCLVVFFGAILIIQIIGMFIHRFGTLAHLLAYTKLNFFGKDEGELATAEWVKRMAVMAPAKRLTLIRKGGKDGGLGKDGPNADGSDGEDTPPEGSFRNTGARSRKSQQVPFKLDNVYEKRMTRLETDAKQVERLPALMRKNTKRAINTRTKKKKTSFGSIDRSDTISSQDINFSLTSGMSVGGGPSSSSAFNRQSMPPRPTLESMKSYPPTSSENNGGGGELQPNSGKISALRERSRSANQGGGNLDFHPPPQRNNAPAMDTILESSRL